jgi:hypothetical protein
MTVKAQTGKSKELDPPKYLENSAEFNVLEEETKT